jgi:hypothetical protein
MATPVVGLDLEPCATGPSLLVDVAEIDGHDRVIASICEEHGPIWGFVNGAGVVIQESIADLHRGRLLPPGSCARACRA